MIALDFDQVIYPPESDQQIRAATSDFVEVGHGAAGSAQARYDLSLVVVASPYQFTAKIALRGIRRRVRGRRRQAFSWPMVCQASSSTSK